MTELALERTQNSPSQAKMSAWTPRFNKSLNIKIFQERFELVKKWYSAWNADQRWQLVEYILLHLSDKDILFLHSLIDPLFPPPPPPPSPPVEIKEDFTRILPRFLNLKIFSYLDPRSLCRASQVCWYWHDLCQQNAVWRPKCLQFGWFLPSPPTLSNPNNVWKRHYVNCVLNMFWKPPKRPPPSPSPTHSIPSPADPTNLQLDSSLIEEKTPTKSVHIHHSDTLIQPLWKHSCRFPKDLVKTSLSVSIEDRKRFFAPRKPIVAKVQPGLSSNSKSTLSFIPCQGSVSLEEGCLSAASDNGGNVAIQYRSSTPNRGSVPIKAMLDPSLIEKMRLGDPSEDDIVVSTINSTEVGWNLAERVEHLQVKSPFPKLKPYYVEADKEHEEEERHDEEIGPKDDLNVNVRKKERDKTDERKDIILYVSQDPSQLKTEKKTVILAQQPNSINTRRGKLELESQHKQLESGNNDKEHTSIREWTQEDFEGDLSSDSELF